MSIYHSIDELLEVAESLEITPTDFYILWDECEGYDGLRNGVDASLIYEGCDLDDLIEQYGVLESNIREAVE